MAVAGIAIAPLAAPAVAEDTGLPDHAVIAPEGAPVTIPLLEGASAAEPGSARLLLEGLPAGSSLSADGQRAVVPGQGAWQIDDAGTAVTFSPFSSRLGSEPAPIRYSALDAAGNPVGPGLVTVTTPLIPNMVRAAPSGAPVVFPLGAGVQNVDLGTVSIAPFAHVKGTTVSDDGTRVTVAGQGAWALDRQAGTVVFTPEGATVVAAAPLRVTGRGSDGAAASEALLEVGYPTVSDRIASERPGEAVQFALMDGARNVAADSFRFPAYAAPAGATVSADGLTLTMPGEGVWTIDLTSRSALFVPAKGATASPTPVAYAAHGLYADSSAEALLMVQTADAPPTARPDELRGRPGQRLQLDLLANDTPGATSIALDPATARISSPVADHVPQLSDATGRRLVIPGEGVYRLGVDGVLTFTPDAAFRGRTTPIEYSVEDAAGIASTASVSIDVDPQAPVTQIRRDSGGINSMLEGIRVTRTSTFTVFATFAALLVFSGAVSLWIGRRMEADRRSL